MSYETPTNDFRQVKRPIKRGNGVNGPGYYEETVGYDITIQRRYLVRIGGANAKRIWYKDGDGGEFPDYETRSEWRDLPTIWVEKPQARAL